MSPEVRGRGSERERERPCPRTSKNAQRENGVSEDVGETVLTLVRVLRVDKTRQRWWIMAMARRR